MWENGLSFHYGFHFHSKAEKLVTRDVNIVQTMRLISHVDQQKNTNPQPQPDYNHLQHHLIPKTCKANLASCLPNLANLTHHFEMFSSSLPFHVPVCSQYEFLCSPPLWCVQHLTLSSFLLLLCRSRTEWCREGCRNSRPPRGMPVVLKVFI